MSNSVEVMSVVVAGGLVWVSVLGQHFANVATRGVKYVIGDRSEPPSMEGFFGRATRVLANNVESAAMYAPIALVVILENRLSSLTSWTALIYIAARVVFTIAYWLKIPLVRSNAWLTGMICTAVMAGVALSRLLSA